LATIGARDIRNVSDPIRRLAATVQHSHSSKARPENRHMGWLRCLGPDQLGVQPADRSSTRLVTPASRARSLPLRRRTSSTRAAAASSRPTEWALPFWRSAGKGSATTRELPAQQRRQVGQPCSRTEPPRPPRPRPQRPHNSQTLQSFSPEQESNRDEKIQARDGELRRPRPSNGQLDRAQRVRSTQQGRPAE